MGTARQVANAYDSDPTPLSGLGHVWSHMKHADSPVRPRNPRQPRYPC
eukprot:CAMPEP_0173414668 /NCGR_PEP_ID=MMETSP1356-20130122/84451_1 /TAXON_ID=77927 ORGANISM="Hemiselmis virescens, Strain PCC157" /NCGR_SAMPLE_ID=MMETSP1356 /ASSEMBLY_ACC=CAM_ASM_000847 /LENGTH=47 /DNA_ID= /DNA_START= /DNA_END= /DNA_ORIENTATION=